MELISVSAHQGTESKKKAHECEEGWLSLDVFEVLSPLIVVANKIDD